MTEKLLWVLMTVLIIHGVFNLWKKWNQYLKELPSIEVKKYFYLSQAVLCSNCDCVFSYKDYKQCPSCGNSNNYYINLTLESIDQKGATMQ